MYHSGKVVDPAQRPLSLSQYLVDTYSSSGDTVVSVCSGTGTDLVAAVSLGRNVIGIEQNTIICDKSRERVRNVLNYYDSSKFVKTTSPDEASTSSTPSAEFDLFPVITEETCLVKQLASDVYELLIKYSTLPSVITDVEPASSDKVKAAILKHLDVKSDESLNDIRMLCERLNPKTSGKISFDERVQINAQLQVVVEACYEVANACTQPIPNLSNRDLAADVEDIFNDDVDRDDRYIDRIGPSFVYDDYHICSYKYPLTLRMFGHKRNPFNKNILPGHILVSNVYPRDENMCEFYERCLLRGIRLAAEVYHLDPVGGFPRRSSNPEKIWYLAGVDEAGEMRFKSVSAEECEGQYFEYRGVYRLMKNYLVLAKFGFPPRHEPEFVHPLLTDVFFDNGIPLLDDCLFPSLLEPTPSVSRLREAALQLMLSDVAGVSHNEVSRLVPCNVSRSWNVAHNNVFNAVKQDRDGRTLTSFKNRLAIVDPGTFVCETYILFASRTIVAIRTFVC